MARVYVQVILLEFACRNALFCLKYVQIELTPDTWRDGAVGEKRGSEYGSKGTIVWQQETLLVRSVVVYRNLNSRFGSGSCRLSVLPACPVAEG